MKRLALLIICLTGALSGGCSLLNAGGGTSDTTSELSYLQYVNGLVDSELINEHAEMRKRFDRDPSDSNRLKLGYVLSRPHAAQDLTASRMLISGLSDTYAWPRQLLLQYIALLSQQQQTGLRLTELQSENSRLLTQLQALKNIDEQLSVDQNDIQQQSQ